MTALCDVTCESSRVLTHPGTLWLMGAVLEQWNS